MKNLLSFIIFYSLVSSALFAQQNIKTINIQKDLPMESMPEFPGGNIALRSFIFNNIIYPDSALKYEIQGKVIVGFAIDTDGSVVDIKILKGIGYCCDEEALRVVNLMPKLNPGTINCMTVKVSYRIPFKFNLK